MNWEIVEQRLNRLLDNGRHSELRGALLMLNEVDVAQYMEKLDREKMLVVFRVLPKDISADVFTYMDTEHQQELIESIGDDEIRPLIEAMFLDDAVDFLEELPAGVVKRVLQNTDASKRELINQFLNYPENSAGSIMTIEFVEFHNAYTVQQAMANLRSTGLDKETIYTSYVIDERRRLMGLVALRKLILAPDDAPILSVMDTNVISVKTLDDQETVADTMRKYDLMTMPVVDNEGRLVGIVTADDIMDVIEAENTEDFEKMAALLPADDQYMKTPVHTLFLNRIPWLLILMISATFTGMIITNYEGLLTSSGLIGVALTSCIPMLMDTGGNCGSQASTLVIRGLALGEVEFKDIFRVLWRELRVAVIVGAVLAVVNFARLSLLNHLSVPVCAVVSLSMFMTVLIANAIGCTLPLLAKRIHLDPALMASPLITTIVDACSLSILFYIATQILKL